MRRVLIFIFLSLLYLTLRVSAEPQRVLVPRSPAFAEPNPKSEVLLHLENNQVVERRETRGEWSKIRVEVPGLTFDAWVLSRMLGPTAGTPSPRQVRRSIAGKVVYVTLLQAYVNVGQLDGVAAGAILQVISGQGRAGSCQVDLLSDHSALCSGARARAGDRVQGWGEVPMPEPIVRSTTLYMDRSELERRMTRLNETAIQKVTYTHKELLGGQFASIPAQGSVGHDTWISSGSTSYQREQVNLSVYNASLGNGWSATADLSTWIWSNRPDTRRFRSDDPVQLYLWQASVEHRPVSSSYRFAAGRIRPHALPGLVMFDGLQTGYRLTPGIELGVYGGVLPDITTLYPEKTQWLAGAYYQQDIFMTKDFLLREESRVGLYKSGDFGNRIELETLWSAAWRQKVDIGVDTKVGLAGGNLGGATLDALRVDLGLRPKDPLHILLGGRVLNRQTTEVSTLVTQGSRNMDATVLYDLYSWMTLGMIGGYTSEKGGDTLDRTYAGPEARFSNVMGAASRVTVGYQEEFGWLRGRMFYLSPQKEITKGFRWTSRGSFNQEAEANQETHEWAAYSGFDLSMLSWLTGRLFAGVRDGSGPLGVTGGFEFSGRL